jgi:hypothetical protein
MNGLTTMGADDGPSLSFGKVTPPSSAGLGLTRTLTIGRSIFALGDGVTFHETEGETSDQVHLKHRDISNPQNPQEKPLMKTAAEPKPTRWFGYDVRQHIGEYPETPNFNSKELRAVMEPHLQKARSKREEGRRSYTDLTVDASIASAVGVPYTSLRHERRFLFDEFTHPLQLILAETLGVDDLAQLHRHSIQDKRALLSPLLTREGRRRFHECYDHFVTSFCIPLLHSLSMTKNVFHGTSSPKASTEVTYRYQAFPCIRVVRPGEFSIGPHCDTAYGHSIGNLNFHIPLTPSFGTNALFTESHPGKEDWHGLTTKSPGLGFLFDGARCLHFTLENTTNITRVSIDFRIAIYREGLDSGELCSKEILADRLSNAGPGFYDEATVDLGVGGTTALVVKKDRTHLLDPDERVGFPFTEINCRNDDEDIN